ncbi:MAG: peptide chain release factor-like protein, partial [Myxococcota bacterium]
KNSTAVYRKHLPSGIEVKSQQSRSQALNRFAARRVLAEKLEAQASGEPTKEQKRIEKLRKQKRRRRRRSSSSKQNESPEDM